MQPYLQFGEVQWWYSRDGRSGMPFYDAYTTSAFPLAVRPRHADDIDNTVSPADYPEETQFLPTLIGQFTNQIMTFVRRRFPRAAFEVLYPLDANDTEFNRAINYPAGAWTPAALDCLKTENFGFTSARNLDQCRTSIQFPQNAGVSAPEERAPDRDRRPDRAVAERSGDGAGGGGGIGGAVGARSVVPDRVSAAAGSRPAPGGVSGVSGRRAVNGPGEQPA